MTLVGVDFAVAHAITAAKVTNTFGRSYLIAISAAKDFNVPIPTLSQLPVRLRYLEACELEISVD
jgi:hypothetical protein